MNFSAFNRLNSVSQALGSNPGDRIPAKLKTGGAFSPNPLETLYAIRVQMDEQWSDNFVVKYRTTMQNRLNFLAQQLRDAYNALLNANATQSIGEGLGTGAREDVANSDYLTAADAAGADAFEGWGLQGDTDDGSMADALSSTRRKLHSSGPDVELRRLGYAGAAMDQTDNVGITMRTEEIPFDEAGGLVEFGAAIGGALTGGDPPFRGKMKVAEYRSQLATGGFWSTVNYLYSFNPRQLKYSYATSYTINSEEAGTRTDGYLFDAKLTDSRDYDADDQFTDDGGRVKWSSTDSNDGYMTEVDMSDFNTVYNRITDSNDATDTITVPAGSSFEQDGVLYENKSGTDQTVNTITTNHFNVVKQTLEFNADSSSGSAGTFTNTESIDRSKGMDGSREVLIIDGDETKLPGSGRIAKNFTQKVWDELFTLDQYNGQEVMGNGTNPFIGNLELASFEGVDRAIAMSKGFVERRDPSIMEINASTVTPTDWYYAEAVGGGSAANIWFPFVKGTVYGEPALPNDTTYTDMTVQFRKVFELSDYEYDSIPDTGLNVWMKSDNAGYVIVNGVCLNPGDPSDWGDMKLVNIPKSVLLRGDNIFGAQVTETGGAENANLGEMLPGDNPGISASILSDIEDRIRSGGSSNYQARVIPNTNGASPTSSELEAFKLETTGSEIQSTNPLAVIIKEFMNDPRYTDIFRLGLMRNLVVRGIANTPNGSTLTGSLTFNYDTSDRRLNLTQTRLTAKQGS